MQKESKMPNTKDIKAGLESGKLKEITLEKAERYSNNEQLLLLMREHRHNIKAYWDEEARKVVFGIL